MGRVPAIARSFLEGSFAFPRERGRIFRGVISTLDFIELLSNRDVSLSAGDGANPIPPVSSYVILKLYYRCPAHLANRVKCFRCPR